MIAVGDSAEVELRVAHGDTAEALALGPEDSFPPVFATSRMVALMELAAARVMRPLLAEGQHSVGVSLDVTHSAATQIGGRVRAVATYLGAEGKLHRFKVEAFDDAGPVGAGQHMRAIVATERLLAAAKRRGAA